MAKAQLVHPAIAGEANWQRAVREYVERLRDRYGDQLAAVVLYGSRARGDADEGSDVDLLVVLRGEFDERPEQQVACDLANELAETYGYGLLGAVVATEDDYRQRMLPLFMNIRREGIELWPVADQQAVRDEKGTYEGAPQRDDIALIRNRMNEALDDANASLREGRYGLTANRAYYAMFHAATALLLSEGLAFSRHTGVINGFSERFVKTGRLPADFSTALGRAFDLRNQADYAYAKQITKEEALTTVRSAAAFVAEAQRLLGP